MAKHAPFDTLAKISQRALDATQECATFRHEALYQAEAARKAGDFNGEAQWRQQAEAWLIQASHHASTHDAMARMLGTVADP